MSLLSAVVGVLDSAGNDVVPARADGTKPLVKVQLGAGLAYTYTLSGDTGIVTVTPDGAASVSAANLTLSGTLTQGPTTTSFGAGSTTGIGSAVVLRLPLADNHVGGLDARIVGRSGTAPARRARVSIDGFTVQVESGSYGADGTAAYPSNTFGLPVALSASWAAGVLSISIAGPSATVTGMGTADAGASTLVTCADGGLTSDLTGKSITITGTVGTTGINGVAAVATWLSSTTFKIPIAWAAWASGGDVALTVAPVIAWEADGSIIVTP